MIVRGGALVLSDGSVFEGDLIGAEQTAVSSGEVVFHTAMTGYQEVISDPSYAGQIVTFTTPHIGNYGTVAADDESRAVFARGVIVREMTRRRSNWRSTEDLDAYLKRLNVSGIAGVDTRRLTRILRDTGAMSGAFGSASAETLLDVARAEPGTSGVDLVSQVTTARQYVVGSGYHKVVAIDFGIKATILRCLSEIATVTVVPASTSFDEIASMTPDGVFLSNGPGDPEAVAGAPQVISELVGSGTPVFGICLGHQLLTLALGGKTFKLPFGHHGANHPVRNLSTGAVEITSQNHNFCVDPLSLSGIAQVTHTNLNDNTNEGMRVIGANAFSVQYHPEAGPGPHDSRYLFAEFKTMMEQK
uniref:Carbamoyl phosphate synthase small chain n=1 Tax=uncultured Actinomycetes bacterium TaxID=152507 RepID=D0U5Z6_9ACTN|nr:carbamoyl-phosphate synthase small subunit [uncultured Actinomycetes bacterium]